ncbi:MAG: hypothetical protein EAY75_05675 [Bacteroidetes bacterium]|nr:MAG: hypothetical protein EAY75_05675 [Bacteroidota bacterium]
MPKWVKYVWVKATQRAFKLVSKKNRSARCGFFVRPIAARSSLGLLLPMLYCAPTNHKPCGGGWQCLRPAV